MTGVGHDDPSAAQDAHRGRVVLIGIGAVQCTQAVITAGRFAALGIQLLDVDLTHVSIVADVGLAVVGNDRFGIDPPIRIGTLDTPQLRFIQIYQYNHSFIIRSTL